MVVRPEEVDHRSERVQRPAAVLSVLSEPHHHAIRLRRWSIRGDREAQRRLELVPMSTRCPSIGAMPSASVAQQVYRSAPSRRRTTKAVGTAANGYATST